MRQSSWALLVVALVGVVLLVAVHKPAAFVAGGLLVALAFLGALLRPGADGYRPCRRCAHQVSEHEDPATGRGCLTCPCPRYL